MKHIFLTGLLIVIGFFKTTAQTIPNQTIDTVVITSTRIETTQNKIPAAISVIQASPEDATRQQLSIQEYLQPTAGVIVQNANNFAQDARISIRGFGARSAFGIRGVKLIVDGIPETTPDGQGQLDNLNLGIIDNIEITKGASSSLYGNASGGVIAIETLSYDSFDLDANTAADFKTVLGSYDFQNYQATAAIGDSLASYIFHGNYTTSNGYRDQSGFRQINTNFKGEFQLTDQTRLTTIINYADAPQADDPGGLTLDEVRANRRQARSRNVLFKTGEEITQFKIGASLNWQKSKSTSISSYAFYSNRAFYGVLPIENGGIIDLSRNYLGQGTSLTYTQNRNTLQIGYDLAYQSDDRERFNNLEGVQGTPFLAQREKFTNVGLYVIDHLSIGSLLLTAGARFDYNRLEAQDRFITNGDDSGSSTLNAFNPSVGMSYRFAKWMVPYFNISTSFETPALSELSANPDGTGGFNEDLEAQKAISFEIGTKGSIADFDYQIASFIIETDNDLVPFEIAEFPDRNFFRNAGSTLRKGVEFEGRYAFAKAFTAAISYAYSDFKYKEYIIPSGDFSDNTLPGIASHTASLRIQYVSSNGLSASVTSNFIGEQFADDGNMTVIDGYELVNFRASYQTLFRDAIVRPFFGINNVLNQEYTDNVRINAFGGRFYEPAPTINIYGGLSIRL